jgi:hypothetical protein
VTEQLTITGDVAIVPRLGPAQLEVLTALREHGNLDDDEAGAILHERRGKHQRDERCEWCARDGRDVLKSLRGHKLAKEKRGDGWVDPCKTSSSAGRGASPVQADMAGEQRGGCPERFESRLRPADSPRARRTDPATSHAAAQSVGDLRESQRAVLATFLQHGPMHDEKLEVRYPQQPRQSESGLRTRRRELVDLGLLRDSGTTTLTVHGRSTTIWELTDQGRAQAQQTTANPDAALDAIGF